MNPSDKVELQVSEEQDGSAVVQMPLDDDSAQSAGSQAPQDNDQSSLKAAAAAQNDDDDGQDDDDDSIDAAGDDDEGPNADDPDREAIRAARREERKLKKQIHREKARESNHLINALKKQNNELSERLAVLEKRTSGAEHARLDKAIDDANVRLIYAKTKLKEATDAADGSAAVEAQEALYEARRQMESLQALKQQAAKAVTQPKQNVKAPDPRLQQYAAKWMGKNDWYDPQGKDPDSRVALTIDNALAEEGWDPTTAEYWEELDNRLQRYLPHVYNASNTPKTPIRRPKTVVTSSGRESASTLKPGEFRLSPDRVRAIKEAGMWDSPDQRNKMIKKFAEWDRQNQQSNRG